MPPAIGAGSDEDQLMTQAVTLTLTATEARALRDLLVMEQSRMDDDGNEGAFAESIYAAIYAKVAEAAR